MTKAERNRKYYLANKKKIAEKQAARRAANKEKYRERDRAYRAAHREQERVRHRDWGKRNRDKKAQYRRKHLAKLNLANAKVSSRTLAAWALQVKQRDEWVCQHCNSEDNLHAHHIMYKGKFPQYALDVDNGITLCECCHAVEHRNRI